MTIKRKMKKQTANKLLCLLLAVLLRRKFGKQA